MQRSTVLKRSDQGVSAVLGKLGIPISLYPLKKHRITSSETVGKKPGFEQN